MSTFTSNIDLELPALGADVNSWNMPLNSNFSIIDQAIAGSTSVALTSANVSLTNIQSAFRIITFTGTLTASVAVTLASITGEWAFDNQTTGAFTVTVKAAAGDTGIVVPQGQRAQLMSNGTVMKYTDVGSVAGQQGAVTLAVADVSGAAPLASPALTGTPTAPTQTPGDNTTAIATDAFVTAAITAQGAFAPTGRLTLTTAVPVLNGAVSGASTIIYTPYIGSQIPAWNGTAWTPQSFAEVSQALSDTTHSPAAAVANSLYDLFVWVNAGVVTLSRGPVWTNATTRSLALSRVNGILTNASAITNGPSIGAGVFVGTIATDSGAATVTFNPTPAAASGGPSGGAWVGLWNFYNRVSVAATAQDNKTTWNYSSATWRQADGSTGNQITFVAGAAEDALWAQYQVGTEASIPVTFIGIGLDSLTVPNISSFGVPTVGGGGLACVATISVNYAGSPVLGKHYLSAMEAVASGSDNYYGVATSVPGVSGVTSQIMQLSAQLRF